ncbi:MAG TPA: enoyl-CoA hydratase/isomerase [Rhizomicrobium sp.]|jgi:2-(1,2-epoxy-1,2-dihydrophenyl)acetyl-CoA isomerase|nr:enoyl-CoA hydratase/isomerase [Rhizomicrobium sp.]
MRTDFERAYVTAHGPVAVLTFNHPEVMNAASAKLVAGASEALRFIERPDSGFRAIVLTGEGRGFCTGANLSEGPERASGSFDPGHSLETVFHPFMRRLRDLKLPFITAVNGAAAGVGMSIALMGDLILAARSAYFLQAFTRIGLVPDGGSTWLLPRLVGLARAKELSLLAERLPAETALEWGLINRVYHDDALLEEALKLATKLAEGPTQALAMTRLLYGASPTNSFEAQIDLERAMQSAAGRTEDFVEGVMAFLQKRQATFKGK